MSKPLIPFGWLPGHWGLKGKTRDRARAEYELSGYDLRIALAELDYADDEMKLKEKINEIEFAHDVIDEEDFERNKLEFINDPVERALATLDHEYQYTEMSDLEYDKRKATIKQEPWVNVIELNVHSDTGNFELDWNEYFIADLREVGFKGNTEEDIVNAWFSRICRDIALSEFSGTGDFDEQLSEAERRQAATGEPDDNGRRVIK